MTTQPDERDRYPGNLPNLLRQQEAKHYQDQPQKDPLAVGTADAALTVRTPERTPRTWRWWLLLVVIAGLSAGTTHDLVMGQTTSQAGDCHSLWATWQGSDLRVCTAVPQSSPSRRVAS